VSTIWVSDFSGTDTDDGSTYALAKKTLAAGLALVNTGDTLNLVNDGDIPMLTFAELNDFSKGRIDGDTRCRGTDWTTAPGVTIQGVDSTGAAAMATIAATRTGSRYYGLVYFQDQVAYATVKGIIADYSALATNTTAMAMITLRTEGAIPIRVRDCEVIGATYGGTTPKGNRAVMVNASSVDEVGVSDGVEISYNVFLNTPNLLTQYTVGTQPWNMHHNVEIWSTDESTNAAFPLKVTAPVIAGNYSTWSYTHNTLVIIDQFTGESITPPVTTGTTNATDMTIHSNLMYLQPSSGAGNTPITNDFFDSPATGSSGTRGVYGYNVWALGSNVAAPSAWVGSGYYDRLHNPGFPTTDNATDLFTGSVADLLVTNTTLDAVFNTTSTTWGWADASGEGYTHVLPFDARPLIGQTTGSGGSVAGAVEQSIIVNVSSTESDTTVTPDFIDSLPFFKPIIKADTVAMVKVRRNAVNDHIDMPALLGRLHPQRVHPSSGQYRACRYSYVVLCRGGDSSGCGSAH